jgi:hypothetical protein
MDFTDPTVQWSALELHRRMQRATSDEDRREVRREINRAREDPAYRTRLAEIAQSGRFASGPHRTAQMGLGAAAMAPLAAKLPVIGSALGPVGAGLGLLGAGGLLTYGGLNLGEAFQRRQEGLPWGEQAAWGGVDVVAAPWGVRSLLRGLKGAKAARAAVGTQSFDPPTYTELPQDVPTSGYGPSGDQWILDVPGARQSPPADVVGSRLVRPGQELPRELIDTGTDVVQSPLRREGDIRLAGAFRPEQTGTPLDRIFKSEGELGDILEALKGPQAATRAKNLEAQQAWVQAGRPGQPPWGTLRGERLPDPLLAPLRSRTPGREVGHYDPETGMWVGGEGYGQMPLQMLRNIEKRRLAQADLTGRREFRGVRSWESSRPTRARQALHRARADNQTAGQLGRELPHDDEALKKFRDAVEVEEELNTVLDGMEGSRESITQNMGRRIRPGPSLGATQVGRNIQSLGDDIVESTSRAAARVEDRVLTTIKGSPKIRDLSDSQLNSILERRQTSRTGPQMAGFAEEREAIEQAISERQIAFEARAGVRPGQTAAAQVDEVVEGGARQEVSTPMEFVERRATIDPILAKGAVQMQALDEAALIIGQGSDEVFEVYGQVGPKLTRTAVTAEAPQHGLLREVVATQQRPIKTGPLVEGPEGSSLVHAFGHRPANRPVGGERPEFKVFESGRGPGSEGKKAHGPRVIERWFAGQGKIFGEKAFKKTKRLNEGEVRRFAANLHRDGITTGPITPEMLTKVRDKMTGIEKAILDQAVMFSIIAQRGGMFKKVIARTTGMASRIKELRGEGQGDILDEMTGAYQTFLREGTFKERQSIIDAANAYTKSIAMLLASIAGAEMMELSGDPRAAAR